MLSTLIDLLSVERTHDTSLGRLKMQRVLHKYEHLGLVPCQGREGVLTSDCVEGFQLERISEGIYKINSQHTVFFGTTDT